MIHANSKHIVFTYLTFINLFTYLSIYPSNYLSSISLWYVLQMFVSECFECNRAEVRVQPQMPIFPFYLLWERIPCPSPHKGQISWSVRLEDSPFCLPLHHCCAGITEALHSVTSASTPVLGTRNLGLTTVQNALYSQPLLSIS